ncbi:MAG: TrmB family transcriptional regulator [Candidatus Latescibacter sp.]|nr:TrmB family transcriptional regulator [Candidatus Latescibacter sp.]
MKNEHIESIMTGLGFSLYESRAYVALVAENPLTGYELSGRSGIPRSKVYECIERLNRKGLLIPVEENPVKYAPLPPEELVRRLSKEFRSSLETLGQLLAEEKASDRVDYIFNVRGYEEIIAKSVEMIEDAEKELALALWSEEISRLEEEILRAVKRGVTVRILAFDGGRAVEGCETWRHRSLAREDFTGRAITVVRDRSEALTGQCSGEGGIIAAWTKNRNLVFISLKYIEHEIIRIRESGGDGALG